MAFKHKKVRDERDSSSFDFDKTIGKLNRFNELSKKKRKEVVEGIIFNTTFLDWYYGSSDSTTGPKEMSVPMCSKLFTFMMQPQVMKTITKVGYDRNKMSRSSIDVMFTLYDEAAAFANKCAREIKEDYKLGKITKDEFKVGHANIAKYMKICAELYTMLNERQYSRIKHISKVSGVPEDLVMRCLSSIPDQKYLEPRYKLNNIINSILYEIYNYAVRVGPVIRLYESGGRSYVNWKEFFAQLFRGYDSNSSSDAYIIDAVAMTILLEKVDSFEKLISQGNPDNSQYATAVWDSLTGFAIGIIESASENQRTHLFDIYMKRLNKSGSKNPTDVARVDFSKIPQDFENLYRTARKYFDKLIPNAENIKERIPFKTMFNAKDEGKKPEPPVRETVVDEKEPEEEAGALVDEADPDEEEEILTLPEELQ